jgi:PPOX class probable F420-dependent enzyme
VASHAGRCVAPRLASSHLPDGVWRSALLRGAVNGVRQARLPRPRPPHRERPFRHTGIVPTLDDPQELRRRVAAAPVARLATVRPDGSARLVPITFALLGELLCFAVDEVKPKRHARLARLGDIAHDPRVTLLVDHYDADWTALWWVRVDGTATVHADGALREQALDVLVAKYLPYRTARPAGPVVIITPGRWSGWSAR